MTTAIVIDDYSKMAALIADRLTKRGFSAIYASSGESALEKLQEEKAQGEAPCICVLDVVMSGLSGVDLMKAIKEIVPEMRFMLITGYTNIPDIDLMQREGAIELFYKPFKIDEMISKINFVVSNTRRIPIS